MRTHALFLVDDSSGQLVDIDATIGGKNILIDVRVTHTTAPSYVQAARQTLGAAILAEAEKIKKHGAAAKKKGAIFVPFVLETYAVSVAHGGGAWLSRVKIEKSL